MRSIVQSFDIAARVVKILQEAGFTTYFAGGFVRDFLLNHPSDDIDIATSGSVEDIQRLFDKTIPVGIQFGIIIVVYEMHHFEVATFRKEQGHHDGRRPTSIQKANAKEDALRRDFTINGMFYDPISEELFDYVEGKKDLKQKVIRAIGDPHERFLEDRLRMIRAVRYAARFEFAIQSETIEAIIKHSNELFPAVALERVADELKKMARYAKNFAKGIELLHRFNLLGQIFPLLKKIKQEEIHQRLKPLVKYPQTPEILMIMQLFYNEPLVEQLEILERLKVSNKEKELIALLNKCKEAENLSDYELAQIYANELSMLCFEIVSINKNIPEEYKSHQLKFQELEEWIERIKTNNPVVTSKHLMDLGIKPSKRMGQLLQEAQEISINQKLKNPIEILKQLTHKQNYQNP